jgi:hypothetical protein
MWESGITNHKNDVVPLSIHTSDEMSNTVSDAFFNYYNVTGVPTLSVANHFDIYGSSAINSAIASNNAASPVANAVGIFSNTGTSITVKTQTKFYTATTGEFYLATYFMENGLVYDQSSAATNPYTHNHVLRGVATGGMFGEVIATGSVASGAHYEKTYTYTAPSAWNMSNVYVALVIWQKSGSTYSIVNSWQSRAN